MSAETIIAILGLGLTILCQLCGTVWFASNVHTRVAVVEKKTNALDSFGDRLARVETNITNITTTLGEIRDAIRAFMTR